jgi:putative transposase
MGPRCRPARSRGCGPQWQLDDERWAERRLDAQLVVYLWADGLYVKAGLEQEKAALLVVIGAFDDGHKEVLAVSPGYRESTESWAAVLWDLAARGLKPPRLVVGDGHLGRWVALRAIWPEVAEQHRWNHEVFARRYRRWYPKAVTVLQHDWERLVTFYAFPRAHGNHLRTTNFVESPFAAVRLRTTAAKRFQQVGNATALIWRVLRVAEQRFRRLAAPEFLAAVRFVDGQAVSGAQGRAVT